MSAEPLGSTSPLEPFSPHLDKVCDRFEAALKAEGGSGPRPRIEDCLADVSEAERAALLPELIAVEVAYRRRWGEDPRPEEYQQRFPEYTDLIRPVFREEAALMARRSAAADSSVPSEDTGPESAGAVPTDSPGHLGRYRITARLGVGAFGTVYRAYDEDLRRDVAIKVPNAKRVTSSKDIDVYLAEARVLASLEHPHIVPVHDFGRTDDGLCYVVSRFIEGSDLAVKIRQGRPSASEATELVAAVAEALHYAHGKGVVHRDIKPAKSCWTRPASPTWPTSAWR
jgi:hypothetical protein